ncbi:ABC transporter ATP-binding protein [Brumicola pallidula]|jgi:glycerol transport system ATP-binding protein|uniref:sn-glycerol-3-phosphate import ATP-binding protein UgpC n=1 Tax=Brumicola pallidula DSM 14239 = ACAM 615 TaxID=1121922 RepID=K6ZE82_9ALTE|nr:ABC transporter ATP-binding protein [Glaciecola pallidula]GAC27248.1 sn-glycerol-3-phosphate import ATP-binding protein UgpC [Glaciecola pallidula DSM 14239 = ACAM 615]
MSLVLDNISHTVNGESFLSNINLTLESGSFNVLLGRTLAGKTTLMRLIAGLDKSTEGKVILHGKDLTDVKIQERNVSMVYQQFVNYPNLTVRENIASPLRIAKVKGSEIAKRVQETAAILQIEPFLDRFPLELSGGQQQRTSMARALVKDASIILFDEPLVNLDYKLREELRSELRGLFKERNAIAIYATTEPHEAMALGGNTTLLHEGRVIQSGAATHIYRHPDTMEAASLYSEPTINLIKGRVTDSGVSLENRVHFAMRAELEGLPNGDYMFGVLPSHIGLAPNNDDDLELNMTVELAEISGSETYMHVHNAHFELIIQLNGIHDYHTEVPVKVYLPTHKLFVFDLTGKTIQVPSSIQKGAS